MISIKYWAALAGLSLSLAGADSAFAFYKCEKPGGGMTYVSAPEKCRTGAAEKVPSYEPPKTKTKTAPATPQTPEIAAPAPLSPSPASLPDISSFNLTAADSKRGQVLLYELQREAQLRALIQDAINGTPPKNEKRRHVLREQQRTHTLNITAIKQELARLGVYADNTGN